MLLRIDQMKNIKSSLIAKSIKVKDYVDSIDNSRFVFGLSTFFVGAFFVSVFTLDKDYSQRGELIVNDTSKLLEIYSLDEQELDIPAQTYIKPVVVSISIIDIKPDVDLPTNIYAKVGDTVRFNNLTGLGITVQSVQGEDLNLTIPQGSNSSTAFYTSRIFYYKVSDGRVGRIFIEE